MAESLLFQIALTAKAIRCTVRNAPTVPSSMMADPLHVMTEQSVPEAKEIGHTQSLDRGPDLSKAKKSVKS